MSRWPPELPGGMLPVLPAMPGSSPREIRSDPFPRGVERDHRVSRDRRIYDARRWPIGGAYRKLIELSLEYSDTFLLVVHQGAALEPEGQALLERLNPFLIDRTDRSEWLSVKLVGGVVATVYRFRLQAVVGGLRDGGAAARLRDPAPAG